MSENKHTPEPWHMRLSDNATPHIEHGDCYLDEVGELRNRICVMPAEISQSFNSFQNASRIVDCVNACAGIDSMFLRLMPYQKQIDAKMRIIQEFNAERDELIQRIASLESDLDKQCRLHGTGSEREARKDARIAELLKQRDGLLAALKRFADYPGAVCQADYDIARAAIASVKGIKLTDNE